MSTIEQIRESLREVVDPCSAATGSNLNIVEMGLVKSIEVSLGHVHIQMRLTTPACHMIPYFIEEVESEVLELPNVDSVELETDDGFEWTSDMMSETAKEKRQAVFNEQEERYRKEQSLELES